MEEKEVVEYQLDPWKNRDVLPKLPIWSVFLIMIAVSLLSGFFSVSSSLPLALFLCTSLYAFLLVFVRHPVVLIVPVGSYAIAYFVSAAQSFLPAFLSLLYVPMAFVLALCLFRCQKCSRTVLFLSLTLLAMTCISLAVFLHQNYGSIIDGGITFWNQVEALCREALAQAVQTQDYPTSLQSVYNDYISSLDTMISTIIYFVPGVVIFCCMFLSWLCCKFVRKLIMLVHAHDDFFYKNWNVMVPLWWVYAYFGFTVSSLVAAFLPDDVASIASLIISNFLLILEGPLFVIGCRRARIMRRKFKTNGMSTQLVLSTIVGIFLLIFQIRLFVLGIAFIGMFYVYRRAKAKKKMMEPQNPQDPQDPQDPSNHSGEE